MEQHQTLGRYKVGDFARWVSPSCLVRIRVVHPGAGGYSIDAIPGLFGTPLDVSAGPAGSVGESSLRPLSVDELQQARRFVGMPERDGWVLKKGPTYCPGCGKRLTTIGQGTIMTPVASATRCNECWRKALKQARVA